jgi:hypothetical protein
VTGGSVGFVLIFGTGGSVGFVHFLLVQHKPILLQLVYELTPRPTMVQSFSSNPVEQS